MNNINEMTSVSIGEPVTSIQRSIPLDDWEELLEQLPHIPNIGREISLKAMSREMIYGDEA